MNNIELTTQELDLSGNNKIIKQILNDTVDKAIQSVSDKEFKKAELEELIKNQLFFNLVQEA